MWVFAINAGQWEFKNYELMKGISHEISVFCIALRKSETKPKFKSSTKSCDEGILKQGWSFCRVQWTRWCMDQLNRQVSRMYFCVRHSKKLVKSEVFLQFCFFFRTGAPNDDFRTNAFKSVLSYLECCLNLCRLILGCAVKFLCAACSVITRELQSSPFY